MDIPHSLASDRVSQYCDSLDLFRKEGTPQRAVICRWFPYGPGGCNLTHLVLQGGGTLGIAHLGFMYGLERAGIRFIGLAGTSAGAIVALLAAAARGTDIATPVAARLLPILVGMPAESFVDGPYRARRLLKRLIGSSFSPSLELVAPAVSTVRRLLNSHGLNPGHSFTNWLSSVLQREFRLRTIRDLLSRLSEVRSLATRNNFVPCDREILQLIASALPGGHKLNFPRDISVLRPEYLDASPALLARASMSIPLFFEPLELEVHEYAWARHLSTYPLSHVDSPVGVSHIHCFDGGVLSNFPIDAFISVDSLRKKNQLPTVGATLLSKIASDRPRRARGFRALIERTGDMLDAARGLRDLEALMVAQRLARIPDTQLHVWAERIDVRGYNWLNFFLEEWEMRALFENGVKHALLFLQRLEG